MENHYDYLIVGSGLYGVTFAHLAPQVSSLVYHQALLALLVGKMSECYSVKTGAYD